MRVPIYTDKLDFQDTVGEHIPGLDPAIATPFLLLSSLPVWDQLSTRLLIVPSPRLRAANDSLWRR
ncbi:MAG: hypothetical protein WBY44_21115 [Bryobacteraceae bacterium]